MSWRFITCSKPQCQLCTEQRQRQRPPAFSTPDKREGRHAPRWCVEMGICNGREQDSQSHNDTATILLWLFGLLLVQIRQPGCRIVRRRRTHVLQTTSSYDRCGLGNGRRDLVPAARFRSRSLRFVQFLAFCSVERPGFCRWRRGSVRTSRCRRRNQR